MRYHSKLIFSGIYIIFLITVFLLFAAIRNASAGTSLTYVSIFIILLLGSLLFGLAVQKKESAAEKINIEIQSGSDSDGIVPEQLFEEKQVEDIDIIDIQKLLPSRTLGIDKYTEELLQNMSGKFNMVQALLFIKNQHEDLFHCYAQYAYFSENPPVEFRTGESLPGQAVKNKTIVSLNDIPDQYMTIASGLGKSNPKHLIFVPLINQEEVIGLIEYAAFEPLTEKQLKALEGISKKVADTINKQLKK